MRLDEGVEWMVKTLTDAGIRAVPDLVDLNPPGVYVVVNELDFDTLAGYTLRAFLYAVSGDSGRMQSYKQLGPLLEDIGKVWPCGQAIYVDLPTPNSQSPLPAFRMPTIATITYED